MGFHAKRSFSWQGYRRLLNGFFDMGYEAKRFSEVEVDKAHVVVRHDVDMCLEAAVDIARIEAEMGVSAHYFVLLRTEFYNLSSPKNLPLVQELSSLGHDVGLHFDASLYDQDLETLERAAGRECAILESTLECDVTTISFHRPAQSLLGLDRHLSGRLSAYHPKFFNELAYSADSRGTFRYGHPHDHEAFQRRAAMQLLTHPIWWPRQERQNSMTLLDDPHERRSLSLRQEMCENCIPYSEYIAA